MSETRLEKVIESTAEAETDLAPETRLEKVILDTGRKIQEEIAEGGGGKLYRHRVHLVNALDLKQDIYINIVDNYQYPYRYEDNIERRYSSMLFIAEGTVLVNNVRYNVLQVKTKGDGFNNWLFYYINSNGNILSVRGSWVSVTVTDTITEL